MRVLYVEDHEDTLTVIGKVIHSMGHEVSVALNCRKARALLEQRPIDLLISDLKLPDGDGCSLMREVRAQYGIPGIAISGRTYDQDIADAQEAGFAKHLSKPLDFAALKSAIEEIQRRRSIPAVGTDQARVAPHQA